MRLIPDSDILFDRDHAGSHLDTKQRPHGAKDEGEGFQKVQNHDSCLLVMLFVVSGIVYGYL